VDPHTHAYLTTLYPLDKSENAKGLRRALHNQNQSQDKISSSGMAPLLKELMAQYAATGLPPAYIPTKEPEEN